MKRQDFTAKEFRKRVAKQCGDQVDFSTDEDHGQQVMFGSECEGLCGV